MSHFRAGLECSLPCFPSLSLADLASSPREVVFCTGRSTGRRPHMCGSEAESHTQCSSAFLRGDELGRVGSCSPSSSINSYSCLSSSNIPSVSQKGGRESSGHGNMDPLRRCVKMLGCRITDVLKARGNVKHVFKENDSSVFARALHRKQGPERLSTHSSCTPPHLQVSVAAGDSGP